MDDEAIIGADFTRILEGLGFEAELAPTVQSGFARAQAAQFDAILVEFNLRSECSAHPRTGNSLKVICQLRALEVTVPVLMFTSMEGEFYETASLIPAQMTSSRKQIRFRVCFAVSVPTFAGTNETWGKVTESETAFIWVLGGNCAFKSGRGHPDARTARTVRLPIERRMSLRGSGRLLLFQMKEYGHGAAVSRQP